MEPAHYDALLFVSFGGPERREDVIPFLENVVRGRRIPRARLEEVAEHYYRFGGSSPINDQNRALIAAIRQELVRRNVDLPIYWGNRNWHPLLPDAVSKMAQDGVGRAIAFVTSAFSSYSGCRQYRENIKAAISSVEGPVLVVDKIRAYFNHPGFIAAMADRVSEALAQMGSGDGSVPRTVFTAHSLPMLMADRCEYVAQLREAASLVSERAGVGRWELAFQSRSGPASQPWLEPDVCDRLREMRKEGVTRICVAPIGFISDHMEVVFDLDVEVHEVAEEIGVEFVRAGTVGVHPCFVAGVCDLIEERLHGGTERASVGTMPALPDVCPSDCCLPAVGRPTPQVRTATDP